MPKPYPEEFRRDMVAVARIHEAPLSQIARNFGKSEATLRNSLCKADVDGGVRRGVTTAESEQL